MPTVGLVRARYYLLDNSNQITAWEKKTKCYEIKLFNISECGGGGGNKLNINNYPKDTNDHKDLRPASHDFSVTIEEEEEK